MSSLTNDENRILKGLLEQKFNIGNEEVDYTKYRYVIYARKSTTSEERQERSITDQVAECSELAKRLQLNVVDIIRESESARESGIRAEFERMLAEVKAGKYQGIIAWHPDRLARNMKDAGAVIDLLDKRMIKDLRFATFTFENSPMGKMLLGISFVLSKQYTDHLSESVTRGNTHSLLEGRWIGKPKHGYYIDPNKRLRPDGHNWNLIKDAFKQRLAGSSLQDIVEYLNHNRYSKAPQPYTTTDKRSPTVLNIQALSSIFKDPFYAGVAIYGDRVLQLEDLYDFTPILSENEWVTLCPTDTPAPNSQLSRLYRSKNNVVQADLMRRMIICGHCCQYMSAGITTKKTTEGTKRHLFYYRCDTATCSMYNKSVRARVITEYIHGFLDKYLFSTEESYQFYKKNVAAIAADRVKNTEAVLSGLKRDLIIKKKLYEQMKHVCIENPNMSSHYTVDLEVYKAEIPLLEKQIEHCKEEISRDKEVPAGFDEFLELTDNLASRIQNTTDITLKDKYIRIFFSNFTIKDKQVADCSLKDPFASWVKEGKFLNGRGSRT